MATIKKARDGRKVTQPTPTYKNLRMGVENQRREQGLPTRGGYGASSADSALYRFGYGRGLRGEKEYPGEPPVQKMGRWEGQNVGKKKPPSKRTGGSVKAKDGGTYRSRSRTVERNPEGTHKMITKSRTTPRGESSSMKERRTLKGVLKGAPKRTAQRGDDGPLPMNLELQRQRFNTESLKAKSGKQMIKRADGSYSQRGLWDNIRAAAKRNKAAGRSGKKPTAAMLKQERRIKAKGK